MDPITWMLLAACLLAYGAKKVVGDSIIDNNYAKQGLVSPRFEAQHGREAAAKADKYGFTDFLRDNWRDYWAKAADARIAGREVKPREPGKRIRWSDRWAAARTVVVGAARKVVDPVEVKKPPPLPDPPPIVDPSTDVTSPDDKTVRFTGTGREQYDADADAWTPIPDEPAEAAEPAGLSPKADEHHPPHAQPEPTDDTSTRGTEDMTAPAQATADSATPTGEAVGVTGGAGQARQIRLAAIALREQALAKTKALARALEALESSAAEMEMDPITMGEIARAREAVASLEAAMTGAAEEVTASMTGVEKEFTKHLPGVELNAAVGGLAKRRAYEGN